MSLPISFVAPTFDVIILEAQSLRLSTVLPSEPPASSGTSRLAPASVQIIDLVPSAVAAMFEPRTFPFTRSMLQLPNCLTS